MQASASVQNCTKTQLKTVLAILAISAKSAGAVFVAVRGAKNEKMQRMRFCIYVHLARCVSIIIETKIMPAAVY